MMEKDHVHGDKKDDLGGQRCIVLKILLKLALLLYGLLQLSMLLSTLDIIPYGVYPPSSSSLSRRPRA